MSKKWPVVPLGQVVKYRKEFIHIDDLQIYKRCRVQLHAQGIVLRDTVSGSEIKTKKQKICHAGELLVAEIDAKVGGYGIVPEELDGAIVSSHYFLFQTDEIVLDKRFLNYLIRTPGFRNQVLAQGSTNYAAIRPNDVFGYKIPLPSISEQRRIVTRIEELAAKIQEAKSLRQQALEEAEALIVSFHADLAGNRKRKMSELLTLYEETVPVISSKEYPQAGVRNFGVGLFPKPAIRGSETAYKYFNRLYQGALVLSQVKGWEGAIAVCDENLAGSFVSPEYRTFQCVNKEARPEYLAALVPTPWFWHRLQQFTRGVGARRERTRPEQFLTLEIPMPDVYQQEKAESYFKRIAAVRQLQYKTMEEIDAFLPTILDREFPEELTA